VSAAPPLSRHEALRALLSDGLPHTQAELRAVAGWRYGARVQELREQGLDVRCERVAGSTNAFLFRLASGGPSASPRESPCAAGDAISTMSAAGTLIPARGEEVASPVVSPALAGTTEEQVGFPPLVSLPAVPDLPSPWDAVFAGRAYAGSDVRHTTSSRRPGVDVVGTVRRRRRQLERCPACGGLTYPLDGAPHAVRWTERGGQHVRVDCIGREVRR
jgi:hypothetical protein